MRVRDFARLQVLAVLSSVFAGLASSQATFDERHAQAIATQPDDLLFTIHTSSPPQFHPGERIPLALEFSSTALSKYKLDAANYDRSGRLYSEEYVLDRDDVADPYADYFGSGVMGGIAGGLRTTPVLGPEPHQITLVLNDWCRFDKPGHYRLFLKAHRVSRQRTASERGDGLISVVAVSNILEIEIVDPDPGWEAVKLHEIESILNEADSAVKPAPVSVPGVPPKLAAQLLRPPDEPRVRDARLELRYLGTHGAVQLILNRARKDLAQLDSFGLIGSPDRSFVVQELDRYIQEPDTEVNAWILRLRTLFEFVAQYPKPLFGNLQELKPDDWKTIEAQEAERVPAFEKMLRERAERLTEVLAKKSEQARQECVDAIAELAPEAARAGKLIPRERFGMTRRELIERFNTLTEEQQSSLLAEKWDLVRGPDMIPVLRQLVVRARPSPVPMMRQGLSLWHGPVTIGEQALQRLSQLAPDQARSILLEDIAKPAPRFAYFALNRLPAQDVPQADKAFAESFRQDPSAAIPLIARFGTAALYDIVAASYRERHDSCEDEASLLAYFLRVKPAQGSVLLNEALSKERVCIFALGNLARTIWNPTIEAAFVAALNHANPTVASEAARALGEYGTPSVERALWRRLEQWTDQWRGRVHELEANPITGDDPNRQQGNLRAALENAIASGSAWFLDEQRRNRLAALAIDEPGRKMWSTPEPDEIPIVAANGGGIYGEKYTVAQYSFSTMEDLKAKLKQFPAGTTFRWCPEASNPFDSFTPGERDDMYVDLARFLDSRGMNLGEYSKDACEK